MAAGIAFIVVIRIPVIALFRQFLDVVTANRLRLHGFLLTRIRTKRARAVHDRIATLSVQHLPIITLLSFFGLSVATNSSCRRNVSIPC